MTLSSEQQAGNRENEGENGLDAVNPYCSPISSHEPELQSNVVESFYPSAPWEPGWTIVTPAAMGAALAVVLLSFLLQAFVLNVFLLPMLSMFGLAILIKRLHKTTPVVLPVYGLISLAFAGVSYFLFLPVCVVTVVPLGLILANIGNWSEIWGIVIFMVPIAITFLGYSWMLRVYLRTRYQNLLYHQRLAMFANHQRWQDQPVIMNQPQDPYSRPSGISKEL